MQRPHVCEFCVPFCVDHVALLAAPAPLEKKKGKPSTAGLASQAAMSASGPGHDRYAQHRHGRLGPERSNRRTWPRLSITGTFRYQLSSLQFDQCRNVGAPDGTANHDSKVNSSAAQTSMTGSSAASFMQQPLGDPPHTAQYPCLPRGCRHAHTPAHSFAGEIYVSNIR